MATKKARNTETNVTPINNRGNLIGYMELNVEFNGIDKETQEAIIVLKRLLRDIPMYDNDKIMAKMVEIVEENPRDFKISAKVKPYNPNKSNDELDSLS